MSRRKTDPRKVHRRRLKEGRGQGVGKDYDPYLTVRDVSSDGWSTRTKGWESSRISHTLSGIESKVFYVLIWFDSVTDVREQFNLDPDETESIAEELGFKHAISSDFHVMTTDFLVTQTYQDGYREFALSCKPKNKLTSRTLEKISIEKAYWDRRGTAFFIITEENYCDVLSTNVEIIYHDWFEDRLSPLVLDNKGEISHVLLAEIEKNPLDPFRDIASRTDKRLGLNPGMALSLAKHMIARKELQVDMNVELQFSRPIRFVESKIEPIGQH
jgi:hypothetical protein